MGNKQSKFHRGLTTDDDWEGEINYVSLDIFQQVVGNLEKELKNSLGICTKLHKSTIILTIKSHLPRIGDLGQLKSNEQVYAELEENMQAREMACPRPHSRITNALMDDHLVRPTRAQNMIQSFMANLRRDMKTLSQNSTAHEVSLESLLYRKIISISGYHEAWDAYIRDKDKGKT
jgi:hypothetical protein